jgi:hypothetical protein
LRGVEISLFKLSKFSFSNYDLGVLRKPSKNAPNKVPESPPKPQKKFNENSTKKPSANTSKSQPTKKIYPKFNISNKSINPI